MSIADRLHNKKFDDKRKKVGGEKEGLISQQAELIKI